MSNGPEEVQRDAVEGEPERPDQRQNDPMTSEHVIEQIAGGDCNDGTAVEPEVHPGGVARPETCLEPSDEASIHDRLVDDVDCVGR